MTDHQSSSEDLSVKETRQLNADSESTQIALEQEASPAFSHPRAYINDDGELAIWVGRPPGYEYLDDEFAQPAATTTGTAGGNRAARRASHPGPKASPELHQHPPAAAEHLGDVQKRHTRGR